MIRKNSERVVETKENLMGGEGEIYLKPYFSADEMKAKCRLCSNVVIPPGSALGLHPHNEEEEIYLIIKGKGIVVDDDVETEVGPGDAIITGNGSSHSIRNESSEDLEFVAVINCY
ncbi:MAG: cupin domain-containing protein [Spirochaetales bacterium]|nr:cupin domain-containing protein [Spirochaetales bacterium]